MTEITEEMVEAALAAYYADRGGSDDPYIRTFVPDMRAALTAAFASRPQHTSDLIGRLQTVVDEEADEYAADAPEAVERGERPDLWDREATIPVAWIQEAISALSFASLPSQGGEWDNVALAACRVAWPNFDTFGTESKSKRLQEMREAFSASPSYGVEGWQDIATAPKDEPILLGKWVSEDGFWYWQASGQVTERGLWIDFMDDDFLGENFQAATHWKPLSSLTKDQSNG